MHLIKIITALLILSVISCAVPCPRNIKLGNIYFSQATTGFIPKSTNFKTMDFENERGENISFTTVNQKVLSTMVLPVKTLCQKGDFLDRTTQVEFLEAQTVNLWYASDPDGYTLAIDITIDGHNPNTGISDTAFIEKVSVWGQRIINNAKTGGISVITSTRGNNNHPEIAKIINQSNQFAIIPDTTILNRNMKNVYYNPVKTNGITIYFTRENGIEAFKTNDNDLWVRI